MGDDENIVDDEKYHYSRHERGVSIADEAVELTEPSCNK